MESYEATSIEIGTSDLYEFLHTSPKWIGQLINLCKNKKKSLYSG
jgi:hypothetical protein